MIRDFDLQVGTVTVKDYHSNIEVSMYGDTFTHNFDGDIEYSLEENINSFIDYEFEYYFQVNLSSADREYLTEKMKSYFYPHSKDCYDTNLKKYRDALELSQSQLAEKSGVNLRMIQKYEQGDKDLTKASVTTVYKLARALKVSIYELMGWEV